MTPTQLFVYGTLRHDQPEHAKYCRGVLGWRPARMRGRLVRIREGYRLIVVAPAAVLLPASTDANADEAGRAAVSADAMARADEAAREAGGPWINGELLVFRDAAEAWPPLDAWEGFAPGRPGLYPRVVVPAGVQEHGAWRGVAVWAYAATAVPEGAVDA